MPWEQHRPALGCPVPVQVIRISQVTDRSPVPGFRQQVDDVPFRIILISRPHPVPVPDLLHLPSWGMAIAYDLPGFIRYRNEPSTMVIPVEQYPAAAIGHSLYVAIWMVGVS